jgi:hypothetical protein
MSTTISSTVRMSKSAASIECPAARHFAPISPCVLREARSSVFRPEPLLR